jgi:Flp pilus assembly protein CpaB
MRPTSPANGTRRSAARGVLALALSLGALALALGACADNQDASRRCAQQGVSTGEACKACCKREGASGYTYIDDRCACVGDRK